MVDSLAWLRPHFDQITADWWVTLQLAYRLQPEIVTLTYGDIGKAIQDLLGNRPDVVIERLDLEYRTYSRSTLAAAIANDKTNRSMAWPERNDCDNYAWRFKSAMDFWYNVDAVGFVLDKSSWHAYNIVVFADKTAALFEPQQDRFPLLDEPIVIPGGIALPAGSSGRYSLRSGLIII
jgi:hypothetical protein